MTLKSTSALIEEVAVSPEASQPLSTAMVESLNSNSTQLKNSADFSGAISENFKTSSDSEVKHLIKVIENSSTEHSTAA